MQVARRVGIPAILPRRAPAEVEPLRNYLLKIGSIVYAQDPERIQG